MNVKLHALGVYLRNKESHVYSHTIPYTDTYMNGITLYNYDSTADFKYVLYNNQMYYVSLPFSIVWQFDYNREYPHKF